MKLDEKTPIKTPSFFLPIQRVPDGKDFLLPPTALESKAELGDPNSQLLIGLAYAHGLNECIINKEESHKWIVLAAKSKDTPAGLCAQGMCYQMGIGGITIKNMDRAKEFFAQAVGESYIPAIYHYAWALGDDEDRNQSSSSTSGSGLYAKSTVQHINEERRVTVIKLMTRCAEVGYPQAISYLGWCYENGWGVKKDEKEAFKLYKMAAESGYAHAKCMLGWCYQLGIGTTQDTSAARESYEAAIKQGNSLGRERLSTLPCCSCLIL